MFGIGLPELILILALALIVVGPEKLPDLAKSLAKQLLELKKTANALKDSLQEELKAEERETRQDGQPTALPLPAAGIDAAKIEDEEDVIDVEARPAETVTPAGDGTTAADAEGGPNQSAKKG
jgi:sec-independent protein translocase protein TatB